MYHSQASASYVSQTPCQADDLEYRRPIVDLKDTNLAYRPQAGISKSHADGKERAAELDALRPSKPAEAPSPPPLKEPLLQVPISAPYQVLSSEGPQPVLSAVSSDPKGQEEPSAGASTVPPAQQDITTSQLPRLRSNSTERVPLPQSWHFPADIKYYKTAPNSLQGYTQTTFEQGVTDGYIIEDHKGLFWNANGRYILLRELDIKHSQDHLQPLLPSALFPIPLFARRATLLRSSSPIYIPLPRPWTFSPNGLYKESFPASTAGRSELDIEREVSSGKLVVDEHGIHHANSTQYILIYKGERDDSEKFYTPRITRVKKRETPTIERILREARVCRATDIGRENGRHARSR